MARRRERLTPDLWNEVDNGHGTPCWIWVRTPKSQWGHCAVWMGGKEYLAHRAMYEQEVGPIPDGLELDHLCKQPSCVRPDHLEPVTHAENIRRSPLAKLTHEDAEFIRNSDLPKAELAAMFGVRREAIYCVQYGKTWT